MDCIITPELRRTSEIPYHSDAAPGQRFIFVGRELHPQCRLYIVGRRVKDVPADQPEWLDDHRHNCPTFYVLIGEDRDLAGLAAEVVIGGMTFLAEAPAAVMIPPATLHHYRLFKGSGWSFHVNVRPDYVESLLPEGAGGAPGGGPPRLDEVYRKAERDSRMVRTWEREDGSLDRDGGAAAPVLWKFISPQDFRDPGLRLHVHQISEKQHTGYREPIHQHANDEVYILFPNDDTVLDLTLTSDGQTLPVRSPLTAYHWPGVAHGYQHVRGDGLIMKVLKL